MLGLKTPLTSDQRSHFIPPGKIRKPLLFSFFKGGGGGGYKMVTLARNGFIQPLQILTLLLDPTHHSFYEHEKSYL